MKYIVGLKTGAFFTAEVEADSIDEAEDLAADLAPRGLCHQEEAEISGDWELDFVQEAN